MLGLMLIRPNFTTENLNREPLTLKQAQEFVGGFIQLVPVGAQNPEIVGNQIMYVNEEGMLKNLPYNSLATGQAALQQPIMGNAILVENEESDFEIDDLNLIQTPWGHDNAR